jgi:hypothetical protein
MTQATAQASVTSQTIAVEHIRISSRRPFAEVRRKLEGTVLNSILALLRYCEVVIRNARKSNYVARSGRSHRSSLQMSM